MFGPVTKITVVMPFLILTVHGEINPLDVHPGTLHHIVHYQRPNSDSDKSDFFDNTGSELHSYVDGLKAKNIGEDLMNRLTLLRSVEDRNGLAEDLSKRISSNALRADEKQRPDFEKFRNLDLDKLKDLFGVSNEVSGESMKPECQNIKGLPMPESGCCGVQMSKSPSDYPTLPGWFQRLLQHGRFTRSARDIVPSKMIKGGDATKLHDLPWMVRLTIDDRVAGIGHLKSCGGTIISTRYIITAAHCLHNIYTDLKQLKVILAEYDSNSSSLDCDDQDCINNESRNVEKVIIHPHYNNRTLQNDIALLRLSEDIQYTGYIRPVCLPTTEIAAVGEKPLIIAGWGDTGHWGSHLKRAAVVNYVTADQCKSYYSYKDDSMFCGLGRHGEDIAHGDSGGPIMVNDDGMFFLLGVSNGKREKAENSLTVPSLFNDVYHHLEWIKSHVQ